MIPAAAIYVLGLPLAFLIATQPFEEQRSLSTTDKVAIGVSTILWPALGVLCWVSAFTPRRKRR